MWQTHVSIRHLSFGNSPVTLGRCNASTSQRQCFGPGPGPVETHIRAAVTVSLNLCSGQVLYAARHCVMIANSRTFSLAGSRALDRCPHVYQAARHCCPRASLTISGTFTYFHPDEVFIEFLQNRCPDERCLAAELPGRELHHSFIKIS